MTIETSGGVSFFMVPNVGSWDRRWRVPGQDSEIRETEIVREFDELLLKKALEPAEWRQRATVVSILPTIVICTQNGRANENAPALRFATYFDGDEPLVYFDLSRGEGPLPLQCDERGDQFVQVQWGRVSVRRDLLWFVKTQPSDNAE